MRDVAALAGVSGKTVSRVINNDRYVSSDVRERVRKAVEELRYVPNMLAQTFRNGRDNAIGLAVPSVADSFFGGVVQAVADEAHARGTAVLITNLGYEPDEERAAVEAVLRRHVSGLIIAPSSTDHRYLRSWQDSTRLVFIDRPAHRIPADSVVHDDAGGARAATLALADAGHRRIGFVRNAIAIDTPQRRLDGYRAALVERGLPLDPELEVTQDYGAEQSARTLRALLDRDDPATAIFCSASQISVRLVAGLHALGRTDVGFVSFGDFPMADTLEPRVSVVEQDPAVLGVAAVQRLFDRLESPTRRLRRQTVLPVHLLARESSGPRAATAVRSAG